MEHLPLFSHMMFKLKANHPSLSSIAQEYCSIDKEYQIQLEGKSLFQFTAFTVCNEESSWQELEAET